MVRVRLDRGSRRERRRLSRSAAAEPGKGEGKISDLWGYPRGFWLLMVVAAIGWAGRLSLPFLTLYLTHQGGFSVAASGMMLALFGAGGMISVFVAGPLVDKFGARRILLVALLGTTTMCLVLATISSQVLITITVLGLGLFSQAMAPSFSTTLSQNASKTKLRSAFSLFVIAQNVGFALLPAAAAVLASVSYRLVYAMEGILCLLAFFVILLGVRTPLELERHPTTLRNALVGVVHVLRDKYFVVFVVQNIVFMMVYLQSQTTLPLVMESQGLPTAQYGLLLALNGVCVVLFQLPADSLVGRLRRRLLLPIAGLVLAIGILMQVAATSFWMYAICLMVWTAAELMNMPVAYSEAVRLSAPGFTGRYVALFSLSVSLATMLGGAIGGVVFAYFGSSALWVFMGIVALMLAVWRWVTFDPVR